MAEELHFDNPAAAAQDPSTDAEALRQLGLAGNEPARRPFAGLQRVQDGFADLLVERLEARRSRCIHGRKSGE